MFKTRQSDSQALILHVISENILEVTCSESEEKRPRPSLLILRMVLTIIRNDISEPLHCSETYEQANKICFGILNHKNTQGATSQTNSQSRDEAQCYFLNIHKALGSSPSREKLRMDIHSWYVLIVQFTDNRLHCDFLNINMCPNMIIILAQIPGPMCPCLRYLLQDPFL